MAKNKPYNYNPKHQMSKSKSGDRIEKKLENTTRIRVDKERLDDFESLDTSFLEGRLDKKLKNNKISKEKLYSEKKRKYAFNVDLIRNIVITVLTIIIVIVGIMFLVKNNFFIFKDSTLKNSNNVKEENNGKVPIKDTSKNVIDDNYLFVGDFYTEKFNFDDLDYHYVKKCDERKTTSNVKDNLNENIYKYNPSILFIELGMIDLVDDTKLDDIINNLEKIILKTKEMRPYAKIYVESVYPINRDVDDFNDKVINDNVSNDKIRELNSKIKKLAKDNGVLYLDIYKLLEDDGKLSEKYTDDGVELNKDGYNKILKEVRKVVDDDE